MKHERAKSRSIDYDEVSKVYDSVRAGDPEIVHHILQGISLDPHSLVLDVGCGTANNTRLLASTIKAKVVGLDISFGMLEKARRKVEEIPLTQGPASALPFIDGSFHFVFMTEVLHHLPDINQALSEIYRVLAPGGSFCIVTQSHEQIDGRMTSRFFPASARVDKERYPDISAIMDSLTRIGFSMVSFKEHQFHPTRLGKDYLDTVTNRGYSMLHKIRKEEYDRGLNALKAAFAKGEDLLYSAGYTFVRAYRN